MFNKIIVADDQRYILKMYQIICNRYFPTYKVLCAEDGEQALELLRGSQPNLLILDLFMPTYNGLEVAQFFRQNYPKATTPIIFASGSVTEVAEQIKTIPNSFYLRKPFEINDFVQLVARLLPSLNLAEQFVMSDFLNTNTQLAS